MSTKRPSLCFDMQVQVADGEGGSPPRPSLLSPIPASPVPSERGSSSDNSEEWRALLEQACRETLREVARTASEQDERPRSIEDVVRNVAASILERATPDLLPPSRSSMCVNGPDPQPLLSDITTSPWMLWRSIESKHTPGWDELGLTSPEETEAQPWCQPTLSRLRSQSAYGLSDGVKVAETVQEPATVPVQIRATSRESNAISSFRNIGPSQPTLIDSGLSLDPGSPQQLLMQWQTRPRTVLLVAKPGDLEVLTTLQDMVAWFSSQGVVILEPQLLESHPQLNDDSPNVRTFSSADDLEKSVDLVITIGGDGTLTWAVSLFRGAMPPVLSFAAGSLGFLTPFPLKSWVRTLTNLLDLKHSRSPVPLVCRMRLCVSVLRRTPHGERRSREVEKLEVQCLNEVLVHRGKSSALVKLDVTIDGERVTLVQADGLILATPTGSTAYSLSAGGSMVHPNVPAILLTPVSPHSLSFRPALLPDTARVRITVPPTARSGAAVSVDGKDVCFLKLGDSVEVAVSQFPLPTICHTNETKDWFASVHEALQWNRRAEQK